METVIRTFLPTAKILKIELLSGGLIHQTNKVTLDLKAEIKVVVLQQFNTKTFKEPFKVMKNLDLVQHFLSQEEYPLEFPSLIKTQEGKSLHQDAQGNYWRMFSFIADSYSVEIPSSNEQLYEAGKAYGTFLKALKDLNTELLEITIPAFHDLGSRFQILLQNLEKASIDRKHKAAKETATIIDLYHKFPIDFSNLSLRAVHNDSKLSNVLFSKTSQKCIAVIDLDTLMPGYVVTDFGDMVRGMCNTATEDEPDLTKVHFDRNAFEFLQKGFLKVTEDWMTDVEKKNLVNGAIYIILEQAIRFLSDYLDQDSYYLVKYPDHNLVRTKNQLKLLQSMLSVEMEGIFKMPSI